MTHRGEIIVEDLSQIQARILKIVGRLIGIKGEAFIGFLNYQGHCECRECAGPTINDIAKSDAEDAINRVSTQTN